MNNIAKAAATLRQGWCTVSLREPGKDNDKFCAVGALAYHLVGGEWERLIDLYDTEEAAYRIVGESPEAHVIATVIAEREPTLAYYIERESEDMSGIIYLFNDRQDSVGPVLEVFDEAARRYENEKALVSA